MATNNRKVILIRTYTAFAFVCVFAAFIVAYLFKIQFKEREHWVELSENLSTTIQTVEPSRGTIFAIDGSVLATSLPIYDLRIDGKAPGFAKKEFFDDNIDSLSLMLSQLFADKSKAELAGVVKEITDKQVTVDFNHPLASRDLLFEVDIISVRDVSEQPFTLKV